MKERIQKILAAAGVASRRHVEAMVLEGRVRVNGEVAQQLPLLVDPASDRIEVDGEPIAAQGSRGEKKVYLIMNKPKGVYCTNFAQGAQLRAVDLLPQNFPYRVYPVGRLDAESRGLLLLTNDGELTNQLTHPRYGVSKTYRAVVVGYVKPTVAEGLQQGVWLADKEGRGFRTRASRISVVRRAQDKSILEITLQEGRNRQVRRMLAGLGHKVRDLTRVQLANLEIKGLSPGQFRELTDYELRHLRKEIQRAREAAQRRESKRAAAKSGGAPSPAAAPQPTAGKASRPARPQPQARSAAKGARSPAKSPQEAQRRPGRKPQTPPTNLWPLDPRHRQR
jgi:23S rRNA pseudouridine2605 synthase